MGYICNMEMKTEIISSHYDIHRSDWGNIVLLYVRIYTVKQLLIMAKTKTKIEILYYITW